jgi:hypothetical protein
VTMNARNMLIIKDDKGEIIGAQVEDSTLSDITVYITPADPKHTLYRVSDVPAEISDRVHPAEFQRMLTEHMESDQAKVTRTSAEDLHRYYSGRVDPAGKPFAD